MKSATDTALQSNELQLRSERALGAILVTLLVVLPLLILAGIAGTSTRVEIGILSGLFAYTALLYVLHRRRHFVLSMHGVVFGLIALGALESAAYGSVRGAATFSQVAALTCGGVFLGRNTLIAAAALSVSVIVGLVYAQNSGWLPTPNYAVTYSHAVIYSVIIVATAMMIYYSRDLLEHVVRRLAGELGERQRAEATLRRNEERMTKLFRSSPAALIIIEPGSGRITEINDAYERIFSVRRDQAIGKTAPELGLWVHEEDRERFLARVRKDGHVRDFRARLRRRDTQVFEALLSGEQLQGESGPEILSTVVDLSAEIQAREALERSEQRFLSAFRLSPLAMTVVRMSDRRFVEVNDANEKLIGYRRGELIGRDPDEIGFWADSAQRERFAAALREHGTVRAFDTRMIRRDGGQADVRVWSTLIDMAGEPCVLSTLINVTDELMAQRKLRESQEKFAALFETSPEGIAVTRLDDGTVVEVNDAALTQFGLTRDATIGRSVLDLGVGHQPAVRETVRAQLLAYGRIVNRAVELRRRDGSRFDALLSAAALTLDGQACVVATWHDVTAQKRAEAQVRDLAASLERRVAERTAELEAANSDLESFGYSVSHDLRAPLRAVAGFSSVLLEDCSESLNTDALSHAKRIHSAALRMGSLIDNLLRLSHIGRAELRCEDCSLSDLANRVAASLTEAYPGRMVEAIVRPQMLLTADPGLIRLALENLLGNAWKFTANTGSARVEVGREAHHGEPVYFVRDNGAGFDMQHADRLFKVFQRLHRTDEFEGTGVGLSIVRRVIERHGGRVWAESKPGLGATFYFTLGGNTLGTQAGSDFEL